MTGIRTGEMGDYLRKVFPSLDYVPLAFVTAKQGRNVYAVLNLAQNLFKQASQRVTTGDLNRVVREALEANPPPMRQNRRPKVYYATQVAANPPTIVLFTNGPELLDNTYLRYLLKTFRDQLPFIDVPISLYVRQRTREEGETLEEGDATHEFPKTRKRPAATTTERPRKPRKTKAEAPRKRTRPAKAKETPAHDDSGLWTDL